jgi:DNA-directed RNA polymerase subunit alpha
MRNPVRSRFLYNLQDEIEKDRNAEAGRVQLYEKMCAEERLKAFEMIAINDLGLSVRACNCLRRGKIYTLAELSRLSLVELRRLRNLGRHTCEEIRAVCENYGVKIE